MAETAQEGNCKYTKYTETQESNTLH